MQAVISPDLILDVRAELGEGPVWDVGAQELVWVDLVMGRVHRFSPSMGTGSVLDLGSPVGAAGLRQDGGLVLAMVDRFSLTDGQGNVSDVPDFSVDRATVRFNDGKVGPDGSFYAGTLHWEETEPLGSLYRLSPDGSVEQVAAGITVSNGLDWSLDGSVLYHADTPTHQVRRFSVDQASGALRDMGAPLEVPPPGSPDGLTIDAEGCIWVALWGGWQVRRYDPGGRLLAIVDVPVAHVTSVAFGGPHMDEMYITTARFGRTQRQLLGETHAGSIFCCRPGVTGNVPFKYLG